MMQKRTRTLFLLLLALTLFAQGAAAGGKTAKKKVAYRQVTGQVISVSSDHIVIKSRSKGEMELAVTKRTHMIGQPVKAGDKATVNYRADKDGNTATRITAGTASKRRSAHRKPGPQTAAAAR